MASFWKFWKNSWNSNMLTHLMGNSSCNFLNTKPAIAIFHHHLRVHNKISGMFRNSTLSDWSWLVADADLLWEKSTASLLVAGANLVWEKSTASWLVLVVGAGFTWERNTVGWMQRRWSEQSAYLLLNKCSIMLPCPLYPFLYALVWMYDTAITLIGILNQAWYLG